jgi:hypothetical protein
MTPGPAAAQPRRQRRRQGLRRGSLTPELIVRESLRLLDAGGREGFSLPKLGRASAPTPPRSTTGISSRMILFWRSPTISPARRW